MKHCIHCGYPNPDNLITCNKCNTVLQVSQPAQIPVAPIQHVAVPAEISDGLNWGAFLLAPFWSISHGVWIGLLGFVPGIGLIMSIALLFHGNELGWKCRRFNSIDQFRAVQREWRWWGVGIPVTVLIAATLFVLFLFIMGKASIPWKAMETRTTPYAPLGSGQQPLPPSAYAPPPTQREREWMVVRTFEGSSIKNTESFNIEGDEWRISWRTAPGEYGAMNFAIFVYNSDGSMKDLAANVIGAGEDSTIIRGAGRYYLTFNTAQPYSVVVEEYR